MTECTEFDVSDEKFAKIFNQTYNRSEGNKVNFNKELKELLEKYAKETGTVVNTLNIEWMNIRTLSGEVNAAVHSFRIESDYSGMPT